MDAREIRGFHADRADDRTRDRSHSSRCGCAQYARVPRGRGASRTLGSADAVADRRAQRSDQARNARRCLSERGSRALRSFANVGSRLGDIRERIQVRPTCGAAAILSRETRGRAGIAISGNRPVADYISFTSIGHARRHDGALQMGTFTVCRRGQGAQKVVLANSGRVRLDLTDEICP